MHNMRRRALCSASARHDTFNVPAGVSIVTKNGEFIPYEDWSGNNPIGVCVKDSRIGSIILDLESKDVKWTESDGSIEGIPISASESIILNYMDGLAYTASMLRKTSSTKCAAGYATSRSIYINGVYYIGYVASSGEWSVLMEYDESIAEAFQLIGSNFIGSAASRYFWTSVQSSNTQAWHFAFNANGGFTKFSTNNKTSYSYVRAVYKYE